MAGLPPGWEWDYDGTRWFYKYKPTGHIQYHFPSEGDEFPDFVDAAEPAPALAPEERLESQQQVKRQGTVGSSQKPSASLSPDSASNGTKAGMTATARPVSAVWEPEGETEENVFQPENFMFLGPGTYADVSPLNDEEDEAAKRSVVGIGQRVGGVGGGNKVVSPAESSIGTPMTKKSEPAQSPAPAETTISTELPSEASGQETVTTENEKPIQDEQSHETAGTEGYLGEPQVQQQQQRFDPVGFMAEMPTGDTAMAHIERHPDPVEIGDSTILAPIETAAPFEIAELPEKHSPLEPRQNAATANTMTQETSTEADKTKGEREPPTMDEARSNRVVPESSASPASASNNESAGKSSSPPDFKIKRKPTVLAEAAGSIAYRPYKPISESQQAAQPPKGSATTSPAGYREANTGETEAQNLAAAPTSAQGDHWAAAEAKSTDPRLEHMPSVLKPANQKSMQMVPPAGQLQTDKDASKPESQPLIAPHPSVLKPARNSVVQAAFTSPKPTSQTDSSVPPMQPPPQKMSAPPSSSSPGGIQPASQPVAQQQLPITQTHSIPGQGPGPMSGPSAQRPVMQQQQPASPPAPGPMPSGPVPIHTSTGPGPHYPPVAIPVAYNQYRVSQGPAPPQPLPPPWIPQGQHGPPVHMMQPPHQPGVPMQMHPPGWVPSTTPGYGPAPVQQRPMQQGSIPQQPMQQYYMPQASMPQAPSQVPPVLQPHTQMSASFASPQKQPQTGIARPQSTIGIGSSSQNTQQPTAFSSDPTPPLQGPRRSSTMDSSNVSPLRLRTESQSSGYPISSPSPMEQTLTQPGSQVGAESSNQNQNKQSSYFSSSAENPTQGKQPVDKPEHGLETDSTQPSKSLNTSTESSFAPEGNDGERRAGQNGTTPLHNASHALGRISEHEAETMSVSNSSIQASNRHSMTSSIQHSPTPSRQSLPLSQGVSNLGQSTSVQPGAVQSIPSSNTVTSHGNIALQGVLSSGQATPSNQARPPPAMSPQGMTQQSTWPRPSQQGAHEAPRPTSVPPPLYGPPAKNNKWTKWFKSSKSTKKPPQTQPPGQTLPPLHAQPAWNGQWQQQPGTAPHGHIMPGNAQPAYPPAQFVPVPAGPTVQQLPPGMQHPGQPPVHQFPQQTMPGAQQPPFPSPGHGFGFQLGFQPMPQQMIQPGPGGAMPPNSNHMGGPPEQIMQPASPAPSQGHHSHHSNSASVSSMMPAPLSLGVKPSILPAGGPPPGDNSPATAYTTQNGQIGLNQRPGQATGCSGSGWGHDDSRA